MTTETEDEVRSRSTAVREDLLQRAVERSMVMGQVMRRAVQQLRSELIDGFVPAEGRRKTVPGALPEVGQAQFFVLHVLAEASPLAVGEIAERCHVAVPTISRMLNHLEANGLIERYIDTANRRVIRVAVTEAGRAAETEMTRRFEAALESVLSPLTDAELADLITAFGHLERLVTDVESAR
ncbi:MAG TPA: MarR family transcriptional regulator [Chloroflexota bacterium]|nr:MarR family transcriptional regulator [Chloroflexota bacterium]